MASQHKGCCCPQGCVCRQGDNSPQTPAQAPPSNSRPTGDQHLALALWAGPTALGALHAAIAMHGDQSPVFAPSAADRCVLLSRLVL